MSSEKADFLLIDNSNSFTKLALSSRSELVKIRKIATREVDEKRLADALRGWRFDSVVLSSVVPEKGDVIAHFLSHYPTLRVSSKVRLGVGIDYPKPKTIGADRLANAASAAAFYGTPVVVVDFGTAVSFDIISAEGNYVGGVIAPGLEAMTDYLHQRTALLPKITLLEPPAAIGKSTRKAMLSGAVYGYRGLVRQILVELGRELGVKENLNVVATGGYADLIGAGLPEIKSIRSDLTLQGLRIIGTLN
ncbi:MAG: Type pantothenate kinase [Chthoniobacteraceae bacterium]|nr:Type pantothenate kinase [Chthoniobacteraceae bacterium]MDB6174670.1 Type pantothenate kinase [Chthoniobacteraceae bacterium]